MLNPSAQGSSAPLTPTGGSTSPHAVPWACATGMGKQCNAAFVGGREPMPSLAWQDATLCISEEQQAHNLSGRLLQPLLVLRPSDTRTGLLGAGLITPHCLAGECRTRLDLLHEKRKPDTAAAPGGRSPSGNIRLYCYCHPMGSSTDTLSSRVMSCKAQEANSQVSPLTSAGAWENPAQDMRCFPCLARQDCRLLSTKKQSWGQAPLWISSQSQPVVDMCQAEGL